MLQINRCIIFKHIPIGPKSNEVFLSCAVWLYVGLCLISCFDQSFELNKQKKVLTKFECDAKLETKIILYGQSKQDGIYLMCGGALLSLSPSCYNKVPYWVYKQQELISHSFRNWKSEILVPPSWVLMRTLFQVSDCHLLTVSSHGKRGKGALWVSFIRTLIPFMETEPS